MASATLETPPNESHPTPIRWQDRIVSTADVLRGLPRIRNTRIPVSLVLGYLAAGSTAEEIVAEFPDLTAEDVAACLAGGWALAWAA